MVLVQCLYLSKRGDIVKIVAVNGSHKGKGGNTDIMVSAFLRGAKEAGAETANILLAEKQIKHCMACKACWFNSPGKCVIKDDMSEILHIIEGADVRILATPLYFDNISSMLKVFMDRLIVTGSPYWTQDKEGECRHLTTSVQPKLMMIANCGYPERSHFQVISHWIKRHARNLGTEVIGEIYASEGALLSSQTSEIRPLIENYIQALETAGKEIVTKMKVSQETNELLEQTFIPKEIYISEVKQYVDSVLKK